MLVKDIMVSKVITVSPFATLRDALALDDNTLVGLVTMDDIVTTVLDLID